MLISENYNFSKSEIILLEHKVLLFVYLSFPEFMIHILLHNLPEFWMESHCIKYL